MIVCLHLVAFLVNEYFPPELQKEARDISREVVAAMVEADEVFNNNVPRQKGTTRVNRNRSRSIFPKNSCNQDRLL